jgi:NADP-dependent 3-hydroxy acid dehydrogenase YdfG
MKTRPFSNQVALVTGGGSGIGRAFAEALSSAGGTVVIASRRADALRDTAAQLCAKLGAERVFPYAFDLRDRAQVDSLVAYVIGRWKALDILINNSGFAVPQTVDQITDDAWDHVMDTNLRGVMRLVRAVLPHMLERDFGDIVNISSQAGKHGYADVPSYCASKYGMLGYAEALRDHLRKAGANIRVFNFCPGLVDVENTEPAQVPRAGTIHVSNLARTLMFALSLDRGVVLEDVGLYAR